MKTLARFFVLLALLMFVGCASTSGGGAPASKASSGDSGGKTLTDEDYKRIGIKGTI